MSEGDSPVRWSDARGPRATPVVTVGVPVYNGERYLAQALEALRDQDLRDVEVLIGDNASTDGSAQIAESFVASDPRFRFLRSDVNRGLPWNYNRLLAQARAPLFMWNASDDVVRPGHLAACRDALLAHPDATVAFSRVQLIDARGETVGEMDDWGLDFLTLAPARRLDLFLARRVWQAIGFGGVIRTAELRDMGGLGMFYGQDIALGTKMALRAPWVEVPQQSYMSRRHDAQMNKLQGGDPVQQVRVFNPAHSRPVAFPQWYLNYRIFAEVAAAPIPLAERARAMRAVITRWTAPNWRFFPFDVKRNAIRLVRGRYVGAYHSS
ncbi:glycosyltransferase family 2 protein [Xylanimonas protaetiae]|uniref:glycosyltransferase family 2 protein n=1 Tax=Xylanimonas protaetiae TaxID=2509457 RepID=UPI0013E9AA27|nr:glycosyltransferase family A protein [Xylanimonas protaetiae]